MSTPETDQVTVRRAPRIPAFLFVGGAVGVIVTLVLTSLYPADPAVGFAALFAYFALYGITGGVVLGAVVGIIVDRVSSRRAKTVTVEHVTESDAE
ncbi:MAG: hypothetical protein BGO97_07135 [Micrococcales bacterium 70-64]|nr:hypothetical protein [Leifsonia sp.]ODU63827.1 MAG: hypothetical protein ABT06_07140 [Leifsonia sp. SCN 70-46]OJX85518.1 MAG: hypothetical protein BGO97_07135 [Micrococcales bacterium 70-64]